MKKTHIIKTKAILELKKRRKQKFFFKKKVNLYGIILIKIHQKELFIERLNLL